MLRVGSLTMLDSLTLGIEQLMLGANLSIETGTSDPAWLAEKLGKLYAGDARTKDVTVKATATGVEITSPTGLRVLEVQARKWVLPNVVGGDNPGGISEILTNP